MIPKPIRVTTTEKYKIHLLYSDGIEGEVDLSHLKGKGVFKEWDKNNLFEKVKNLLHSPNHNIPSG